jgi:hypothetical protein
LEDHPKLLDVNVVGLVAIAKSPISRQKRPKNKCLRSELDQIEGNALCQERSDIGEGDRGDSLNKELV